jgi:TPR repeat protein
MSGPRDLAELEARAKTGDAQAQYVLSAVLSRQGKKLDSREWLRRAVASGHPEALFTHGTNVLNGLDGPRDVARAEQILRDAVAKGSNAARRPLAVMSALGANGKADWLKAIELIVDAALANFPPALRELGLLVEMAAPNDPRATFALLQAARGGDGLAAFAVIRRSAKTATGASQEELMNWSEGLRRNNHPQAHDLTVASKTSGSPPSAVLDRNALLGLLREPPGQRVPMRTEVSESPLVLRIDKLMTAEECEYIVGIALPQLQPSMVTNPVTGQGMRVPDRSSSTASLAPLYQDIVVHCINLRLAAAAKLPYENGEMLSILRYDIGQEYTPHFDFLGSKNDPAAQYETAGQRVRTLLVYLNTDYDGGETEFLSNRLKVKGNVGDAVLFHNVDAAGNPDLSSRHAGLPVTRGTKWLASKWFRERAYRI